MRFPLAIPQSAAARISFGILLGPSFDPISRRTMTHLHSLHPVLAAAAAALLLAFSRPAGAQLTMAGLAWGTPAAQVRAGLERQGWRFRGVDQDGDQVFGGPRASEAVATLDSAGLVGVELRWPGTPAGVRARYRVVADSLRRVLGPPARSDEESVTWERGGAGLWAWTAGPGGGNPELSAGITARGPAFDAELERRSDAERAENERIEAGEQPRDTLLVGDWMRAYSDARVLASFDSMGAVRVGPGVWRTRFRESWMFTRRLENGTMYSGAVREVEIDCRTRRERLLRTVPFHARRSAPVVEVPPARRRWSAPAPGSAEAREIRRACEVLGAG